MSPPASVTITQLEPVIFLRGQSSSGEDARGRRRPVDFDAPPSQLRALVTLHLPKPSKIKEISISLKGTARTDWPEGIGPNRVEMVEEMTIFQHSISLFNAKDANDSVPRARPRSNSVGPGIGLQEDVDWDYAAAAASARTSARQASGSVPRPINTTGRRDEEGSRSPGSQGQSSSNLARQIALGAAKAGSAIIPPTLRPDLSHMKLRDSPTSPSHLRPPARPPLHRTGSGTTSWTSEQTSPDLESTSPRLSPTANFSGSWTRGGPPQMAQQHRRRTCPDGTTTLSRRATSVLRFMRLDRLHSRATTAGLPSCLRTLLRPHLRSPALIVKLPRCLAASPRAPHRAPAQRLLTAALPIRLRGSRASTPP